MKTIVTFLLLYLLCLPPGAFADVRVLHDAGTQHVTYISGNMLCMEGLVDGRWVVLFRNGDGRFPMPNELWQDDSFVVALDYAPVAAGFTMGREPSVEQDDKGHTLSRVFLKQETSGIALSVCTQLDGTPTMVRWLEITNEGAAPKALTDIAPWAGRLSRGSAYDLGWFAEDDHGFEGWFEWQPLPLWNTRVNSLRGQGHDAPFFLLRNKGTGEYFAGQLEWSANWRFDVNLDLKGVTTFRMGPFAEAPLRILAPGETVRTPAVHLTHLSGSLDNTVQAMHAHARKSVLPARSEENFGLIQYLVPADWGYYVPFDESSAMKCVDVAKAVGAELFILDAYWWDVTCDWVPSEKRFPKGLEPLIQGVRDAGMKFGLYFEPEGGRGNVRESRLAKEHPEWLGPKDIVNLGNPEAVTWVEAELMRLSKQYALDMLRVDFNPEDIGGGLHTVQQGLPENNYWRYYEGCYPMYQRLGAAFPDMLLQQCAGGGARNDLGMMREFHENYLTDGLNLGREQQSFAGQTLCFPPEQFVILHGATGHISPGYPENFDTILRTTSCLGTPQIFSALTSPDIQSLSDTRRERFLHYANLYKNFIRPNLRDCLMYHHSPVSDTGGVRSGDWFAVEFTSPDRRAGWAMIMRLAADSSDDTYRLLPRGLDPGRTYRVTTDSTGTSETASGADLMRAGIGVRLPNVAESELVLFESR